MRLKKAYTFLYMPEDHGASRQFRLPRWIILGAGSLAGLLLVVAALYGIGLVSGNSWLPGGSRLQLENRALEAEIQDLDTQVADLRTEMDDVYHTRNLMAAALELPTMDRSTYAAGVGGRGLLADNRNEVDLLGEAQPFPPASGEKLVAIGEELDLLRRQARIQRQGYEALLDTLAGRAELRAHIPSIRPVDIGWLSSRYGFRNDPFTGRQTFHRGLDFSVPVGTPVRATGDGVVVAIQQQRGLGKVVKISHGNDVMTVYAHLSRMLVKKGETVERGQVIGESGNSGRSTAPHLHYEIRIADRSVNPLSYILDSYAVRN